MRRRPASAHWSGQLLLAAILLGAVGSDARKLRQSGGVRISTNITSFVDGDKVEVIIALVHLLELRTEPVSSDLAV